MVVVALGGSGGGGGGGGGCRLAPVADEAKYRIEEMGSRRVEIQKTLISGRIRGEQCGGGLGERFLESGRSGGGSQVVAQLVDVEGVWRSGGASVV